MNNIDLLCAITPIKEEFPELHAYLLESFAALTTERDELRAVVDKHKEENAILRKTQAMCHCGAELAAHRGREAGCNYGIEMESPCPFEAERDELRAVVDKLPKCWRLTEAGKLVQDCPVIPTKTHWCGFRDLGWHVEKCEWTADGWKMESGSTPEECYLVVCNTEAAAKAASDNQGATDERN